jgi:hypothetical protein
LGYILCLPPEEPKIEIQVPRVLTCDPSSSDPIDKAECVLVNTKITPEQHKELPKEQQETLEKKCVDNGGIWMYDECVK